MRRDGKSVKTGSIIEVVNHFPNFNKPRGKLSHDKSVW